MRTFRLPIPFSYLKKCRPTLLQNRHWVEKKSCSLFSIFCLKSQHQIYSNVSKAKPLPLCNRCLFHITSCKRSFTSAFKCVITSVPSAEQQSFHERSARVSSLVSFSHSGRIRSPFGIRRIVIPRPRKNQNARTSPVPIPTETRPRGLLIDQAIARKTREQHKVNFLFYQFICWIHARCRSSLCTFTKSKQEFLVWSLLISPNVSTVMGMRSQLAASFPCAIYLCMKP